MKILAFISQSGNVMKTTLATSVAIVAAKQGYNCAIADLDIEHRTAYNWMKQRHAAKIEPQLVVYPAKSAQESLTCFNDETLRIIDAPSRATKATQLIASYADLVVLPTPPSYKDIDLTLATFYQLIENGIDPKKIMIVFTRISTLAELRRAEEYIADIDDPELLQVLSTAIWEKVAYRSAVNDGYGITETPYLSLNINAKKVIGQILDFLENNHAK